MLSHKVANEVHTYSSRTRANTTFFIAESGAQIFRSHPSFTSELFFLKLLMVEIALKVLFPKARVIARSRNKRAARLPSFVSRTAAAVAFILCVYLRLSILTRVLPSLPSVPRPVNR